MKNERPVLVTGGAGFIGSHLVHRLVRDGRPAAVLIRETTDTRRIADILPQLTVIRDDMTDAPRLKKLLTELNPSGVFHCAASNIKQGVAAAEDELIRTNIGNTVRLLQALGSVDYAFFVNSGSYLEYGTHEKPLKESDQCEPLEIYALTKLAMTLYGQSVARSAGKPVVALRIFSPYGPQMEEGRLVEAVVRKALRNEDITLTSPDVSRDFIFIDDLVELYMQAAERAHELAGEVLNAASGRAVTLKELVDTALALTKSHSKVVWGGAKSVAYDKGCQEADMIKTFAALLWRPSYDVRTGIERMTEWLKVRYNKPA